MRTVWKGLDWETNEMGDQWELCNQGRIGGPMRWGTNENRVERVRLGDQWELYNEDYIGGRMRWGTNGMGNQWDGRPMRWGTNDVHPCQLPLSQGDESVWQLTPRRGLMALWTMVQEVKIDWSVDRYVGWSKGRSTEHCGIAIWAPSQYEDRPFYGKKKCYYKDKTTVRPFYLYNGHP